MSKLTIKLLNKIMTMTGREINITRIFVVVSQLFNWVCCIFLSEIL